MMLSYLIEPFGPSAKRKKIKAKITTEHSASSYGQPVIVLPDGGVLDLISWTACGYKIEKATPAEKEQINKIFSDLGGIQ